MKKQTDKTLIINPSKKELEDLTLIDLDAVLNDLTEKYTRQHKASFKPMLVDIGHIRVLVSNVEAKVTALQKYAGEKVDTFDRARAYAGEVLSAVFNDPRWQTKLVRNEVIYSSARQKNFGLNIDNKEVIEKLQAELSYDMQIIVNEKAKPKSKTKTNKEEN